MFLPGISLHESRSSVERIHERTADQDSKRKSWGRIRDPPRDRASGEAGLVENLRAQNAATISLIAEVSDQIVGHILFSPATIERGDHCSKGLGLAPVSVLPEFQRRRIGARLIKVGLAAAANSECEFVIVLGHPEYYPKFGFAPASGSNVGCEFECVPDEAFMICWFKQPESIDERVIAKYHPVFSTLG
jgi:putative acetyltransferase